LFLLSPWPRASSPASPLPRRPPRTPGRPIAGRRRNCPGRSSRPRRRAARCGQTSAQALTSPALSLAVALFTLAVITPVALYLVSSDE
jgi:hypothetical protein